MRTTFSKIFVIIIALGAVSCGSFSKLLKSNDNEMKYRKALEYYHVGKYTRTTSLLQDVLSHFNGTVQEDSVVYYIGASFYKQGDFHTSGELFDDFRRRYGRSPFLEDVEYMYAKGYYYLAPLPQRDQTATRQAIMAVTEYLNRYPNSVKKEALEENVKELYQKLYDKALLNARVYYDVGYYNSAVVALKNAIEEYPESNNREELSYMIVSSYYHYARNSVETAMRQRYMSMQDAYYSFVTEFPDSKHRKDVDKMQDEAKKFLSKYSNAATVETSGASVPATDAAPAPAATIAPAANIK